MKIKPIFRWYDLYVGLYLDTKNKYAYLFPLPTLGFRIDLQSGPRCRECDKVLDEDEAHYLEHTCSECEQQPYELLRFRQDVIDDTDSELLFDGARMAKHLEPGMIIAHNFGDPIMDDEEYCRVLKVEHVLGLFPEPRARITVKMLAIIHNGKTRVFDMPPEATMSYYKYERKTDGQ
jgi:hypothetical protein